MHVGNESIICPQNRVDTFHLESIKEKPSSILDMVDVEGDKHCMETVSSWTYLGDVLQSNGKCDLNIKDKVENGIGAINQIIQMLSDLCLGPYYYEAFKELRSSLFLSSVLSNCEAWVGLTKKNISDLESLDEHLLRSIFFTDFTKHAKTPIELLYLETGTIPIRFTLMSRRLNFCRYLLNQDENSLLSEFFRAQCESPTTGDWVSSVKQDLVELDIDMTFDQIRSYSKDAFKIIVKKHVKAAAFKMLISLQQTHSKAQITKYSELDLQTYLGSEKNFMTNKEKAFAFTARSHMLNVKCNFKFGKADLKCRFGCDKDETQDHLYDCPAINDVIRSSYSYNDLFSNDPAKVKSVTKVLMERHQRLESQNTSVNRQPLPCSATADLNINPVNPVNPVNVPVVELDFIVDN